ncbi:hypothetical protein [Nostoc sp. 'Lobaria pulmonaria (5183) cyanobiont']|uniref:hypothetical protein n=1 Tax=Nostoc sp. 'Lobaria pulmonaria (5183) cyanobiont' TaxID=1618022 RepID=UPI000CF32043|nr:hypothetical protein [Nostoc sp. 'Lobaria pulmonaria (5183) cyanobiont']
MLPIQQVGAGSGGFFYTSSSRIGINNETFQKFLNVVSIELGDDMALIQIDRASAHQALALCWPENIIAIFQPSHSPQLNPLER